VHYTTLIKLKSRATTSHQFGTGNHHSFPILALLAGLCLQYYWLHKNAIGDLPDPFFFAPHKKAA